MFGRAREQLGASDAAGQLVVEVQQPEGLQRYRFALGITDFLTCST